MSDHTFTVPAVHCARCVAAINESVRTVPGVTGVDVDLATKTVRITGNADRLELVTALAVTGYDAG